jgi:hypothetical protein
MRQGRSLSTPGNVAEIRRNYGYRDFRQGTEAAALTGWLAN